MNKNNIKKVIYANFGITTISLTITIAILFILAGVTINIVKNKGLIDITKQTKEQYEQADQAEQEFESELKNRRNGKYATTTNEMLTIEDNENIFLKEYRIYGNSEQDTETYGEPSVDNAVEIQSVGDYDETTDKYKIPVTVSNKNLFNPSYNFKSSISYAGITVEYLEDEDVFILNGTATTTRSYADRWIEIPVTKGEYFSISTKYVSGTVTKVNTSDYAVGYFGGADILGSSYNNWMTVGLTEYDFKRENRQCNYNYINRFWFYISQGVTFDNYKVKIQLEKGSTATEYEPYRVITKNIYLKEPLRAIGDVADYIDFKEQKVVRKINKYTFLGNEEIQYFANGTLVNQFYFAHNQILRPAPDNLVTNIISNSYKGIKIDDRSNNFNTIYSYSDGIAINDKNYTTVQEYKTMLQQKYDEGNPIYAYYFLATPYKEDVTLPDIPIYENTKSIITVNTSTAPSRIEINY